MSARKLPQNSRLCLLEGRSFGFSSSSFSLEALGAAEGQRAAEAGEPGVNGEMKGDEEDEEDEI